LRIAPMPSRAKTGNARSPHIKSVLAVLRWASPLEMTDIAS